MSVTFKLNDETGAQQVMGADSSKNVDIGNGTPPSPFSMDGTAIRNASASRLDDAKAPPISTVKTTGTASVGAGASVSITTGLTRNALFANAEVVASDGVWMVDFGPTLTNFDTVSHSSSYLYI